jgi:hypothetical protein
LVQSHNIQNSFEHEDLSLQGYDTLLIGKQLKTGEKGLVPSSSRYKQLDLPKDLNMHHHCFDYSNLALF